MNSNNPNIPHDDAYEHLDADLGAFARMLDDAGATDRGRLRPEAAARIGGVSLAALHGVVETSARISELGAIDRAAGSSDLEARVFEASRAGLVGAGHGLRLAGEGAFPRPAVVVRSGWTAGRVRALAAAAILLLASAGVMMYIGVRPGAGAGDTRSFTSAGGGSQQSVEALAALVSTQMDTLFVAMESVSTLPTESPESEFKPEWLDDLGTSGAIGGGAS